MTIKLYYISELTLAHKIYLINAKCLDINIQAYIFLHKKIEEILIQICCTNCVYLTYNTKVIEFLNCIRTFEVPTYLCSFCQFSCHQNGDKYDALR